jgi:hypothetical protein
MKEQSGDNSLGPAGSKRTRASTEGDKDLPEK